MRLLRNTAVPTGSSLVVFRTAQVGLALAALAFLGLATLLAAFSWRLLSEIPPIAWVVFAPLFLIALLFLWLLVATVYGAWRAARLPTHWVMKVGQGGVWLQLRSYLNHSFEDNDDTALFLGFDELAGAGRVDEKRVGREEGETQVVSMLELVVDGDLEEVERALARERARKGPRTSFLGITSTTRAHHRPVFVARPGRIRVEWRGKRMLRVLAQSGVAILPPRTEAGPWGPVPREAVDDRIVELLERGERIEAILLLRDTHGMTLAEAKAFVEDLSDRAA